VYIVSSDSSYVQTIIRALFENVFTPSATDPDSDYYLLGLLPLPSELDIPIIDSFVSDITAVLGSGDCVHISDFIGCTNGELYEDHIKSVSLSALRGGTYVAKIAPVLLPTRMLPSHHSLIVPAIKYLLAELPERIAVNEEKDDSNLRSLCTSPRGGSKKRSIMSDGGGGDSHEQGVPSPDLNSPRRMKQMKQGGENHLWFYLQLEIECYNTAISACEHALTAMLDFRTCPPETTSLISDLERKTVPKAWLKFSFGENRDVDVPLTSWVRQLSIRRKMLNVWLSQRYPEFIYLHLLHDPDGFMYALKQCFAEAQQRPLEDVLIDARILTLPFTSLERHNEIAKINSHNMKSSSDSFSVVVAGAQLMNSRWLDEHYSLEFLNPSFASKYSQELYLKVSATCEDSVGDDDYQCPLYTVSDFPTADSFAVTVSSSAVTARNNEEPLFRVSIPSQCPLVEWKKRNVTMHASPAWHIPDV